MTKKPCPDCAAIGRVRYKSCKCKRAHPKGRCHTCHRSQLKSRTAASHDAYVVETYGLRPGEYKALYAAQGGRCYICLRAKGLSRRLAVDHDHATGFVRGLLCTTCNKELGHARDDPAHFERAIEYLKEPPAIQLLGERLHKDFR